MLHSAWRRGSTNSNGESEGESVTAQEEGVKRREREEGGRRGEYTGRQHEKLAPVRERDTSDRGTRRRQSELFSTYMVDFDELAIQQPCPPDGAPATRRSGQKRRRKMKRSARRRQQQ